MKKIIVLCICILLSGCSENQKYDELNQLIEQLKIENETLVHQVEQYNTEIEKLEEENERLQTKLESSKDLFEKNDILSNELELCKAQLVNTTLLRSKTEVSSDKDLPGIYVSEDGKCYIIFENGWFVSFYKKDDLLTDFEGTWYIKDSILYWGSGTANEYSYKMENNVLYLYNELSKTQLQWKKLVLN